MDAEPVIGNEKEEGVSRVSEILAGRSLPRQILRLSFWPLMEQILAFFVGLIDMILAGHMATGEARVAALDAMGMGAYVAWFLTIFQAAVGTGVMALVSRATGARDRALANRGLGQGLWLGFIAGFASWAMLAMGGGLMIRLVGLNPTATEQATTFISILGISAPFSGVMFAANAALRGSGDTRTPFLTMVVVNIVNSILSSLFVFGPAPFGGHGIGGIATGTVIAWGAGMLIAIMKLLWRRGRPEGIYLDWTGLKPHWETMLRVIRVGRAQSLEVLGMWLIHMFGVSVITHLPVHGALGAHMLALRIESMGFLPGFAIGTAGAALAGQFLGAEQPGMATKAVRVCWRWAAWMMGAIGLIFIFGRYQILDLMAPNSTLHRDLAAPLLLVCAIYQPFFATCIVLKTTMRVAGATGDVMRWSYGSMILFRVIVLWLLSKAGILTLWWVWMIFAADVFVQASIFSWLHFRGKWLKAKV